MIETSLTSPLRVDFVADLPGGGRLGMTFAPGKKDAFGDVGWVRDLDLDLERLRGHYRADVLVSLIEDHELSLLEIPTLVAAARDRGLSVVRFPIRDLSVPDDMPAFVALVGQVLAAYGTGRTVVAHCRGGLGRTGLVVACCVVALRRCTAAEAVASVRRARPGTVELPAQEAFVERFSRAG